MENLGVYADAEVGMRGTQLLDEPKAKGDHLRIANLHDVDVVGQQVDHRDNLVALAVVNGELKLHGQTS